VPRTGAAAAWSKESLWKKGSSSSSSGEGERDGPRCPSRPPDSHPTLQDTQTMSARYPPSTHQQQARNDGGPPPGYGRERSPAHAASSGAGGHYRPSSTFGRPGEREGEPSSRYAAAGGRDDYYRSAAGSRGGYADDDERDRRSGGRYAAPSRERDYGRPSTREAFDAPSYGGRGGALWLRLCPPSGCSSRVLGARADPASLRAPTARSEQLPLPLPEASTASRPRVGRAPLLPSPAEERHRAAGRARRLPLAGRTNTTATLLPRPPP